jgi:nicotinate-nucleotide adenylyltransferase
MRTLLFGGSFDPPHRGHTALLIAAAKHIKPERILLIPTGQAPLKHAPHATTAERVTMTRLGIHDRLPRDIRASTQVELFETSSINPTYTVHTLRHLKKVFLLFEHSQDHR